MRGDLKYGTGGRARVASKFIPYALHERLDGDTQRCTGDGAHGPSKNDPYERAHTRSRRSRCLVLRAVVHLCRLGVQHHDQLATVFIAPATAHTGPTGHRAPLV